MLPLSFLPAICLLPFPPAFPAWSFTFLCLCTYHVWLSIAFAVLTILPLFAFC
ncbi:hypothetical protein DFS34DRAFT_626506, partial [Phlyctochytrium arcticum]